jgi:DNA-binding SARP family transcriptional activator/DNA-binding CsgD family transcriptional regulator
VAEPDGAPEAGLRIGVLGPLTVHRDGRRIVLGGRREAAVLVALVLEQGRVVSADALVDAVWPAAKPGQPLPSLLAHVSHLRRRLDPAASPGQRVELIERVGPGYSLRVPAATVDAWRFEALLAEAANRENDRAALLTEALAQWRGEALAGFADEQWARATAERWSELRAVAREQLLGLRLDRGESAVLIPELEALVAQSPLREERWRLLVLALYRAHRQADALAALRRIRGLLADELGVDPGPALRSLESEILTHSANLHVASTAPGTAEPPAASPVVAPPLVPQSVLATPGLATRPAGALDDGNSIVDRDRELASISDAVRSAIDGDGRVVSIEGPAGIGKTRLLREVRARAGSATVLAARGSQLEREYGFGVIRQLFEPIVAVADSEALFAGAAASARSVFQTHQDSAASGADTTFGVLHGLYWLTAGLAARSPLIITVDDVQWCDVGSLRFLGFLAHRLEGLPAVLVVTLRTGEQHDNEDLLTEIVSEEGVLVVTPRPLSSSGVDELVRARLGDDPDEAFVAACRRTTGGNPLLLRQLLRALESDGIRPTASNVDTVRAIGSRAVSSLVLRRFARMPAESRAAARAVSILGDGASVPRVAALTGLDQHAVAEAIGALARAEVMRHEYPLEFVHPLVRDAVYGDIPVGTREIQHELAARQLTDSGAPAEQIAAQLLKSPPRGDQQTVEILRTAAARSVTQGAPDGAATYLRRALLEPPAPTVLPQLYLELGRVETMTDVPAALEHLTAANQLLTDARERAHAAVMLGRVEIFAGSRGHARRTTESIIDQLPTGYDDERQWLQAMSRISMHMHALGAPTENTPEISGAGPGARSLAATLAWETTLAGIDRRQAVDLARFALAGEVLDDVDLPFMGVIARNILQIAEAAPDHQWNDALAKAYHKGSLFAVLGAQVWGGYAHWQRGELDEAVQWLRNCTEQNDLWGAQQIGQTYTDAFMVEVLLERGDLAAAQALLATEPPYWQLVSEGHALLETARARTLFHAGQFHRALSVLDHVDELSNGVRNPAWRSPRTDRAVVYAAIGRTSAAIELLTADLAQARRWGTSRGIGRTLRLLGQTRAAAGIDELREAIGVLETGAAKLELAKANAALGAALSTDGSAPPAEALAALHSAFRLAAESGAATLRQQVERLLTEHGVEVPPPPQQSSLTTTERRIVEMSLDGAFDQEIAQALFITTPTVRQTLDAVRGRLGVSSAQQLRAAVATR